MAEFIFTKEKIVAPREKIGMVLQKHTIDEVPPQTKDEENEKDAEPINQWQELCKK